MSLMRRLAAADSWLGILQRYLLFTAGAHVLWEFAHIPLYEIWEVEETSKITYAALHCTVGDIVIAQSALIAALAASGVNGWPKERYFEVALLAVLVGFSYTIYSEWHNVYVAKSWAYTGRMPLLPPLGIGLSPLAQ